MLGGKKGDSRMKIPSSFLATPSNELNSHQDHRPPV